MPVEIKKTAEGITAFLSGEIDHHSAPEMRGAIDAVIASQEPKLLRIDFGAVSFSDSSGVGLVMGRYRNIARYGGKLELSNLSGGIKKVMKLSGIEKIARII